MTFTPVYTLDFFKRRKANESRCKYNIFSFQKWDESEIISLALTCFILRKKS